MAKHPPPSAAVREHLDHAKEILEALGIPEQFIRDRTAFVLLAALRVRPGDAWADATNEPIGVHGSMGFMREHLEKDYAENSREDIRKKGVNPLRQAAVLIKASSSTNDPGTAYRVAPEVLELIRSYGTAEWEANLEGYLAERETLREQYAQEREMTKVPVQLPDGKELRLSGGQHSELIRDIVQEFAPRFTPGGIVVCVDDTGNELAHIDKELLARLGVVLEDWRQIPDVIVYHEAENWLVLIESVTSVGPMSVHRLNELKALFGASTAGLVFVTAFPDRKLFKTFLGDIAWETEVWIASEPDHMIHFNGERFLGPYDV